MKALIQENIRRLKMLASKYFGVESISILEEDELREGAVMSKECSGALRGSENSKLLSDLVSI